MTKKDSPGIYQLLAKKNGLTKFEISEALGLPLHKVTNLLHRYSHDLRCDQDHRWWIEESTIFLGQFETPTESQAYENEKHNRPRRSNAQWNSAEDALLKEQIKNNVPLEEIAKDLERSSFSIVCRAEQKGLIKAPESKSITKNDIVSFADTILGELSHIRENYKASPQQKNFVGRSLYLKEPFVGAVKANNLLEANRENLFFICRGMPPTSEEYTPGNEQFYYASYFSPVGRLIALSPSHEDIYSFEVRDRTGRILTENKYKSLIKNEFRVSGEDIIENVFTWAEGRETYDSLNNLDAGATKIRKKSYSVSLPDRPILDNFQDEIFREPINSKMILSGPPGSGKTTLLLKRIAQKTQWDFLTDYEKMRVNQDELGGDLGWIMFTPNDLLKGYLKEAMAIEKLPASDANVSVFDTYKLTVLREIEVINVGGIGFFKREKNEVDYFKSTSIDNEKKVNVDFEKYLEKQFNIYISNRLDKFFSITKSNLKVISDTSRELKIKARALEVESEKLKSENDQADTTKKLDEKKRELKKLKSSLGDLFPPMAKPLEIEIKQLEEESRKPFNLKSVADNCRIEARRLEEAVSYYENTFGFESRDRNLSHILSFGEILKNNLSFFASNSTLANQAPDCDNAIMELKNHVENLGNALGWSKFRNLINPSFSDFRQKDEVGLNHYKKNIPGISDRTITTSEENILLYQHIKLVTDHEEHAIKTQIGKAILNRRRLLVVVDEAADFSPIEIECMRNLCKPNGGIILCGDLMQRMNKKGIKRWDHIISHKEFEKFSLNQSYRQSAKLFSILNDLYENVTGEKPNYRSAYPQREEDPPAISHSTGKGLSPEQWLTDRIAEIYNLSNRNLPTTAILVPTADQVGALRDKIETPLQEMGFEVDAATTSQSIGDTARVRIFPVEQIKGLEFEAIFYVGIDQMAVIHKSLIDKFVYVGLSRARSFLGVTFESQFPIELESIKNHFLQGETWG